MDDAMLKRKFADQCVGVLGDNVKKASDACWAIESVGDIANIAPLL